MKLTDLKQILPPLLSIFILMNAIALFTTFTPLFHEAEGTSRFVLGLITAAYYLGMTIGAFKNTTLVLRIGHIRAFSAFTSLITAAFLLNGIFQSVFWWILFRAIVGYCLAGLYIVIESWVLNKSTTEIRGQALALYMIALNGASATGQFLLNTGDLTSLVPFVVAGVFAALSIFPLSTTKLGNPQFDEPSALTLKDLYKASPTGAISCFCSGLLVSTVTGFLPLYIQMTYNSKSNVATAMFAVLLGSVFLQYTLGKLSDRYDRRNVMIGICAVVVLLSLGIIYFDPRFFYLPLILIFLFGGFVFAIYPISISHACDVLSNNDIVAATQGLLLIYGFGAITGPLLMPFFINFLDREGIFIFFIATCTLLSLYLYRRTVIREAPSAEDQQDFIPVPHTTPIIAELDPRSEDESASS